MTLIKGVFSSLRDLFAYFWQNKRWWLIPVVVLLLLCSALIILGSVSGVGPLIYTLF